VPAVASRWSTSWRPSCWRVLLLLLAPPWVAPCQRVLAPSWLLLLLALLVLAAGARRSLRPLGVARAICRIKPRLGPCEQYVRFQLELVGCGVSGVYASVYDLLREVVEVGQLPLSVVLLRALLVVVPGALAWAAVVVCPRLRPRWGAAPLAYILPCGVPRCRRGKPSRARA
jgi:hypothetical protein